MGRLFEQIDERLATWMGEQSLFFVATAPNDPNGHVNVSPKGSKQTFAILGPTTIAYVDLIGSGIETVSHIRENGRIVVMFCAFSGAPKIFRFHGRGEVIEQDQPEFAALLANFTLDPDVFAIARTIVKIEIERISDSCGFVVPKMELVEERDQLPKWAKHQHDQFGDEWKTEYLEANNRRSIDGLPGLDFCDTLTDAERKQRSSLGRAL
ncbi:pyridoxamine 5'-phosphate oxidase family protein [soil metagenome]